MTNKKKRIKKLIEVLYVLFCILVILLITVLVGLVKEFAIYFKESTTETVPSITTAVAKNYETNSIFVDELDRSCEKVDYWTYYDTKTNCYFKFDTDKSPSQWTYYYVGFSDKYEEPYGWMVYNKYNERWSINTGDKQWEIIDDQVAEENEFWHFKYAYGNTIVNKVNKEK